MVHPAVREFMSKRAKKGGKARAAKLTPEQRQEIARKAVEARWAKEREQLAALKKGTQELLKTAEQREAKRRNKKTK